jgi:hypothetical protein
MAEGEISIAGATISTRRGSPDVLLRVSYKLAVEAPPAMGDRLATLTEDSDRRLVLRCLSGQSVDFTSRLAHLQSLKTHRDGIARRFARKVMRHKGSSRQLSEKLDAFGFERKAATMMHQWSHEIVQWARSMGCGCISMVLVGGDWPAHDLQAKVKYKAAEAGIEIVDASLGEASTERAAKAKVQRDRKRAKQVGDAIRTLTNNLETA